MAMQPIPVSWVGGSNPGRLNLTPPPPPPKVGRPGFEPPTENLAWAVLPFDRRLCASAELPHCLEPFGRKLLTPPPTPPPHPHTPKSDIQF